MLDGRALGSFLLGVVQIIVVVMPPSLPYPWRSSLLHEDLQTWFATLDPTALL